jgi:hypothetical protein
MTMPAGTHQILIGNGARFKRKQRQFSSCEWHPTATGDSERIAAHRIPSQLGFHLKIACYGLRLRWKSMSSRGKLAEWVGFDPR